MSEKSERKETLETPLPDSADVQVRTRLAGWWVVWAVGVVVLWTSLRWPLLSTRTFLDAAVWDSVKRHGLSSLAKGPLFHCFLAFLTTLAWMAPGRWLLGRLAPPFLGATEEVVLAMALGLGSLGTVLAVLALMGLFGPMTISVTVVVFPALALLAAARGGRPSIYPVLVRLPARAIRIARRNGGWSVAALFVLASTLGFSLARALIPPWYPDALFYHLSLPRLYLEGGGFVPVPQEPINAGHPGLAQMLFSVALSWRLDDVAAVFSWVYYPLAVLGTALLARRTVGPWATISAAVVVGTVPHLAWVAGVPLADAPLLAYVTLALHAVVRGLSDRSGRWNDLAALLVGFAVATKYQALVPGGLLMGFISARSFLSNGGRSGAAVTTRLCFLTLLPFLPWAVRNVLHWGTPVFPLHVPAGTPGEVVELLSDFRADWQTHGHGASVPWLPFDLTFLARPDDLRWYEGEVGPLLLTLLPLPMMVRSGKSHVLGLGLFALVQFIVWTVGAREIRYLFPAIPALIVFCLVVSGAGFWFSRKVVPIVTTGAALCLLWFLGQSRPVQDVPYLLGIEDRAGYYLTLSATRDLFGACEALRGATPGSCALFFWEDRGFLCPVRFLADHLIPGSSNDRLYRLPRDPRGALARLRSLGVTHLLLNLGALEEARRAGLVWRFRETFVGLVRLPGVTLVYPQTMSDGPHGVLVWYLGSRS